MQIKEIVLNALHEDLGHGDITTIATVPSDLKIKAVICAREEGILTGSDIAKMVFKLKDPSLKYTALVRDGKRVHKDMVVSEISGNARSILSAERVALNFMQHLSGISTLTNKYVKKMSSKKIRLLDTRKTTPNMRVLEKYAVKMGGGFNHRFGLFDGILIKDNHVMIAGGILEAVKDVRQKYKGYKIEVEAQTLSEVKQVMGADFDIIMLDNMGIPDLKKAIKLISRRYKIEISGGVNLDTIRDISKLDVDFISVGAVTHSAMNLNMSLDIITKKKP